MAPNSMLIWKCHKELDSIGNGANLVDTTFIDNAVSAHLCAAEAIRKKPEVSGRTYFISNNEPVQLWAFVNDILNMAGIDPIQKKISARSAMSVATLTELAYKFLRLSGEPQVTRFLVHELARSHWFDITSAREMLGYEPKISIEEGFKKMAGIFSDKTILR